ncbi:hypothetical protein GCM10020295_58000 [Streptomyces cinereospinus]
MRKDPYASQNRIVPEEDKPAEERGLYLHPQAYDQPRSRHIHYERERAHEESQATLNDQAREFF